MWEKIPGDDDGTQHDMDMLSSCGSRGNTCVQVIQLPMVPWEKSPHEIAIDWYEILVQGRFHIKKTHCSSSITSINQPEIIGDSTHLLKWNASCTYVSTSSRNPQASHKNQQNDDHYSPHICRGSKKQTIYLIQSSETHHNLILLNLWASNIQTFRALARSEKSRGLNINKNQLFCQVTNHDHINQPIIWVLMFDDSTVFRKLKRKITKSTSKNRDLATLWPRIHPVKEAQGLVGSVDRGYLEDEFPRYR